MDSDKDIYKVIESYWCAGSKTPDEIQEKFNVYLTNLKIKLIRRSPFYSDLLNRLSRCILATPEMCVKHKMFTASTDGRHIIFCPAFVANLSSGEFNFIVMHELYHIIMNHSARAKQLGVQKEEFELWNRACDGAINPLVDELQELFYNIDLDLKKPTGDNEPVFFTDDNGDIRKESAEVFFKELKQNQSSAMSDGDDSESDDEGGESSIFNKNTDDNQSSEQDEGSGDGKDNDEPDEDEGNESEGESGSESEDESKNSQDNNSINQNDMEKLIKRITGISDDLRDDMYKDFYDEMSDPVEDDLKAYNESSFKDIYNKNQSSAPGFAKRFYDNLVRKVPVKWSVYLRRFLTSKQSDDVSFSTPNKFYLPHGMIKPGNCTGDALDNISFYIDTSGSISTSELNEFFNSAYSIAEQFDCTISIYLWHTTLYAAYENIQLDSCKKVLASIKSSSGGTAYSCCLEHMQNINQKAICYVVLTDGYIERITRKIPKFIFTKTLIAISEEDFNCGSSRPYYLNNLKSLGKIVVR